MEYCMSVDILKLGFKLALVTMLLLLLTILLYEGYFLIYDQKTVEKELIISAQQLEDAKKSLEKANKEADDFIAALNEERNYQANKALTRKNDAQKGN